MASNLLKEKKSPKVWSLVFVLLSTSFARYTLPKHPKVLVCLPNDTPNKLLVPLVTSLFLVAMPFVPSDFLLLVVRPGAPVA